MAHITECKSIAARKAFIQDRMAHSGRWLCRGLLAIFDRQTADEQRSQQTKIHNGIGFSGVDGEFMSSLAVQFLAKNGRNAVNEPDFDINKFFSSKQIAALKKNMNKYAGQLERISRPVVTEAKPIQGKLV